MGYFKDCVTASTNRRVAAFARAHEEDKTQQEYLKEILEEIKKLNQRDQYPVRHQWFPPSTWDYRPDYTYITCMG